jgi:hypothetical protein
VLIEGLRRAGRKASRARASSARWRDLGSTKIGDFPLQYGPKNHNGSNFVDLEMYTRNGSLMR